MENRVEAIRIQRVRHRTAGRRDREDEVLCLECGGGRVLLARSVLEAAGDSWDHLRSVAKAQAQRKQIPFEDETE